MIRHDAHVSPDLHSQVWMTTWKKENWPHQKRQNFIQYRCNFRSILQDQSLEPWCILFTTVGTYCLCNCIWRNVEHWGKLYSFPHMCRLNIQFAQLVVQKYIKCRLVKLMGTHMRFWTLCGLSPSNKMLVALSLQQGSPRKCKRCLTIFYNGLILFTERMTEYYNRPSLFYKIFHQQAMTPWA